jgi:hypothetical protein
VAQTSISPGLVNLTWSASTDNVAVASYKIFRDGNLVGTVGPQTSFSDNGVAPNTTYGYTLQAVDWKGNPSGLSAPLGVTTPPAAPIFSDGFESGDLSNWDTVSGLTVESTNRLDGSYSAESISDGTTLSDAQKTLPSAQPNLYYELHFKIVSPPASGSSAYLGWFRTANPAPSGAKAGAILGFFVSGTNGKLGLRNNLTKTSITNGPVVTDGAWHKLQVHVNVSTAQVETWLDGLPVSILTTTYPAPGLGTDPVGIIQLGENTPSSPFDIVYDDVAVDTVPLP